MDPCDIGALRWFPLIVLLRHSSAAAVAYYLVALSDDRQTVGWILATYHGGVHARTAHWCGYAFVAFKTVRGALPPLVAVAKRRRPLQWYWQSNSQCV